jgi:hypothetical protein
MAIRTQTIDSSVGGIYSWVLPGTIIVSSGLVGYFAGSFVVSTLGVAPGSPAAFATVAAVSAAGSSALLWRLAHWFN